MISGVSFGNNNISMDPTKKMDESLISQPGAYSSNGTSAATSVQSDAQPKKGKALKVIGGIVAAAAAVVLLIKGGSKLAGSEKAPKFIKDLFAEGGLGQKATSFIDTAFSTVKGKISGIGKKAPKPGDPNFIGPLLPQAGDINFVGPLSIDQLKAAPADVQKALGYVEEIVK